MSIKLHTQNLIIEKAKTKKDGCYRFRGVAYRVRDGKVTHLGSGGELFEFCYGFNVVVGKYDWSTNSAEAAQALLKKI